MKTIFRRLLFVAGAAALMGAGITNPLSCEAPDGDSPNPYLRDPDRICAPGTVLNEKERKCVCP